MDIYCNLPKFPIFENAAGKDVDEELTDAIFSCNRWGPGLHPWFRVVCSLNSIANDPIILYRLYTYNVL